MRFKVRDMKLEECEKINDIDASQYIGKAWRDVDGVRQLVEINYQDPTWPNGYDHHFVNLQRTIKEGGRAFGAFDAKEKLLGFATINKPIFGEECKYILLDQLFISLDQRNKGIGSALFKRCAEVASTWAADRLFICAGSAEETIAFYRAIGCSPLTNPIQSFYEMDPNDYQLEYDLNK